MTELKDVKERWDSSGLCVLAYIGERKRDIIEKMSRQFVRARKRGMTTSTAKKVVVVDGSRTPFALASTYVVL